MPGKGIVPRRSFEPGFGEPERVRAQCCDFAHSELTTTGDGNKMAALEEALKSATPLTLNGSKEHGAVGFGDLTIGKNRGDGEVYPFNFSGESIPDDGVIEGSAGIDLALEVVAALRQCHSNGVARDTVPEIVAA